MFFALNAVKKNCLMKLTQMHQTVKFGLMSAFILMKSLFENKLHQTASKHDFFFFSIFFEIMVHLKCVKRFIKHARFMEFDELFDAFAPAIIYEKTEF